jgi:hypothetical protein
MTDLPDIASLTPEQKTDFCSRLMQDLGWFPCVILSADDLVEQCQSAHEDDGTVYVPTRAEAIDACWRASELDWSDTNYAATGAALRILHKEAETCAHDWVYSGTAYGGDDPRYSGEGRCYCAKCGADGDA